MFLALYVIALGTSLSGMEIFASLLGLNLLALKWLKLSPKDSWGVPPLLTPIIAFVCIATVGILCQSETTWAQKKYDLGRMRFFLVYIVLYYQLKLFDPQHRWFRWLIAMTLVIAVYGTVQHFIPLDLVRPEGKKVLLYSVPEQNLGPIVVGTFNHHLSFANVYTLYGALLMSIGLKQWPQRKWLLPFSFVIFLLCFWTHSRITWAAIPIIALIVIVPLGWKWLLRAGLIATVVLAVFYFTDSAFHHRLNRTFIQPKFPKIEQDVHTFGPRLRLWRANWQMFVEHPFFGVGYNNSERFSKDYVDRLYPGHPHPFHGHAHSTPFQILSSTGGLGFLCFLWLWTQVFLLCLRGNQSSQNTNWEKSASWGLLAAFIGFHIQGLTQWNFGDAEVLHNIMFFWALAAALQHPAYNEKKNAFAQT